MTSLPKLIGLYLGALALGAVVVGTIPRPPPAEAPKPKPFATACPSEPALNYLLDSGVSLHLPRENAFPASGTAPEGGEGSLGCKGNPIHAFAASTALTVTAEEIGLRSGGPWTVSYEVSSYTHLDVANRRVFTWYKADYGSCEVTSEGLEICYGCHVEGDRCIDPDRKGSKRSGSYVGYAAPGVLDGADGTPFSIECATMLPTDDPEPPSEVCHLGTLLAPGLQASYRLEEPSLPRDKLIAFDRVLRHRFLQAVD